MLPLDTTQEINLTHESIPESEHCDYIERSQLAERRRSALVDTQPCIPAIEDVEATRRECTCHAPNPDSARDAREAFDAFMGEPLRLWDHMMAGLRKTVYITEVDSKKMNPRECGCFEPKDDVEP